MNNAEEISPLIGHIDNVTEDGVVTGWSWDASTPGRRVDLTIVVDNIPVGNTAAANFRADLKAAGIGDGKHALVYILPWELLGKRRTLQVSLRDAETALPVGQPFTLLQQVAATLDERLGELEGQVRLLQSRCDELIRLSARESQEATSVLFETIGGFFIQLADDAKSGTPHRSGTRLGSLIETVVAAHPTLNLPVVETPLATIYIEACAPLDDIYTCIASLYSAGVCDQANMVLLDPGTYDDATLVPTVIRNLRYIRLWDEIPAECNKIVSSTQSQIMVLLAASAHVSEEWLSEINRTFEQDLKIAVVGGKVVREDGIIHHTGLLTDSAGKLSDWGAGQLDDDPLFNLSRPVDGFGTYALAIRQSAFLEVGGFDPTLDELAPALMELCFKLRALGRIVQYQPLARATWFKASVASDHWVASALGDGK